MRVLIAEDVRRRILSMLAQGALLGAVVLEGWAASIDEARALASLPVSGTFAALPQLLAISKRSPGSPRSPAPGRWRGAARSPSPSTAGSRGA